jgi:hypothetical protein
MAVEEAHRMASGAQTDPWGNFLGRSRHGYDSHAVTDGYPGPRSATWLRQLTHSLGIVTAERGMAGATRCPSAQTAGNSRNTVKEPHIERPIQKAWDPFRLLGRQWAHRHQSKNRWPFHGAATERIFAPRPSVDPRIAHARSQPHPKWASFWGTTRGWGATGSRAGPRLTCVCLDRPISGSTDNVCKKATLVQRVTHLVRFQAYRSVELDTDTRHKCWYQSSTGM